MTFTLTQNSRDKTWHEIHLPANRKENNSISYTLFLFNKLLSINIIIIEKIQYSNSETSEINIFDNK